MERVSNFLPPKMNPVFEAEGCLPAPAQSTEYMFFGLGDDDSVH